MSTSANSSHEPPERVRAMFGEIAERYDALNRILSLGIDHFWREEAVRAALERRPERILDVATGTADLAIALKQAAPYAEVIGSDFAEPMLKRGREKVKSKGLDVRLEQADALALPFGDASFSALTIAYGIRNIANRRRALKEFHRVLKPGGRLVVLEFPPPPENAFGALFRVYLEHVSPYVARLLSGRGEAYRYLARSVIEFPKPEAFAGMMQEAGFEAVRYKLQSLGISALHVGLKQGDSR